MLLLVIFAQRCTNCLRHYTRTQRTVKAFRGLLIKDKHKTELNNRMEWNWDHFHRFRHCPLNYILLLK